MVGKLLLKQIGPNFLGLIEDVLDEGDVPRILRVVLPRGLDARRGGLVLLQLLENGQRISAQQ